MKRNIGFGVLVCLITTILFLIIYHSLRAQEPILQPIVNGKVYESVQLAIEDTAQEGLDGYTKDENKAQLVVFYKNDCKYCIGGIGGVLEEYSRLSDDNKKKVAFYDVDTEQGKALARELGATKSSQIALVGKGKTELVNYATEEQTADQNVICYIMRRLEDRNK